MDYPFFDTLQSELRGRSYDVAKRLLRYHIAGALLKANPISVGTWLAVDTRVHVALAIKTRGGKSKIKEFVQRCSEEMSMSWVCPTSFHSEGLVGKVLRPDSEHGRPQATENRGHLNSDFLLFDDASEFLNDKCYENGRSYVRTAMDDIGRNLIVKRSVEDTVEESLKYHPQCSILFLTQPSTVPEELVTAGLFARPIILLVQPPLSETEQLVDDLMDKDINEGEILHALRDYFRWAETIKRRRYTWTFPGEVKELLKEKVREVIEIGRSRGMKASNYTNLLIPEIEKWLIKLSVILAGSADREEITIADVSTATRDFEEFWALQLDYISTKVKGTITYAIAVPARLRAGLSFLFERGAFSEEEGEVTVNQYLSALVEETGQRRDSVRVGTYTQQKRRGLLESVQVGSRSSKVWLTEEGKRLAEPEQNAV